MIVYDSFEYIIGINTKKLRCDVWYSIAPVVNTLTVALNPPRNLQRLSKACKYSWRWHNVNNVHRIISAGKIRLTVWAIHCPYSDVRRMMIIWNVGKALLQERCWAIGLLIFCSSPLVLTFIKTFCPWVSDHAAPPTITLNYYLLILGALRTRMKIWHLVTISAWLRFQPTGKPPEALVPRRRNERGWYGGCLLAEAWKILSEQKVLIDTRNLKTWNDQRRRR